MTAAFIAYAQRLKAAASLIASTSHAWGKVATSPALDDATLPAVSIDANGGMRYPLTVEAVVRIVGECYEIYRRSVEPEAMLTAQAEAFVAELTNDVISSRKLAAWVPGSYKENDLFTIIERVFLDRNHTGLATVLVHRMHASISDHAEIPARLNRGCVQSPGRGPTAPHDAGRWPKRQLILDGFPGRR